MSRSVNILVVDDEYIIRNWLSLLIEKNRDMGLALTGTAPSGAIAIGLCQSQPVDIVVTDIKMAPMDGIELIRALKAQNAGLRYVILSNYEDFSAAQEGMRLGASDYFLKAEVEDKDLLACLKKLRTEILAGEEVPRSAPGGEASDMALLRQQCLVNLFRENPLSETRIDHLRQAGISLNEKNLVLLAFSRDQYLEELRFTSPEYRQMHHMIAERVRAAHPEAASLINVDGNILCLVNGAQGVGTRALSELLFALRDRLGVSASVSVSAPFDGLAQCLCAYQSVLSLFEQRFYTDGQCVCAPAPGARTPHCELEEAFPGELSQIISRINRFEYQSAHQKARGLLENISSRRLVAPECVRRLCAHLVRLFSPQGESGAESQNRRALDEALEIIPLCADLVKATLGAIENSLHQRYAQHIMTEPVEQAVNYIHKNFAQNISLSAVASLVHLSESYLSKVFKEKTGESFNSYLSGCRINHAKYLLRESNARIGAIGAMVGYPNMSYFTHVFKRCTGMSPDQYRSAAREGEA